MGSGQNRNAVLCRLQDVVPAGSRQQASAHKSKMSYGIDRSEFA